MMYKVGDKVRVIVEETGFSTVSKGDEGVVVNVQDGGEDVFVKFATEGDEYRLFYPRELELITGNREDKARIAALEEEVAKLKAALKALL